MKKTVYKFAVPMRDNFIVRMPREAKVLHVQEQNGELQMWAMVNAEELTVARAFALRGTGHECGGLQAAQHVGTATLHGGSLVFHLFDLGEV